MDPLILYLSALSLVLIFPQLCFSNSMPLLSLEEHKEVWRHLETKISSVFPTDESDTSEVVSQEPHEAHEMTFYNLVGDSPKRVFVSVGTKNTGKNVIVLLRKEDYIDPFNQNTFVVLRKRASGDYNVHLATIWKNIKGKKLINWENVLIVFETGIREVVGYITQVQAISDPIHETSIRPACGWFGIVLLCDSDEKVVGSGHGEVPSVLKGQGKEKAVVKEESKPVTSPRPGKKPKPVAPTVPGSPPADKKKRKPKPGKVTPGESEEKQYFVLKGNSKKSSIGTVTQHD